MNSNRDEQVNAWEHEWHQQVRNGYVMPTPDPIFDKVMALESEVQMAIESLKEAKPLFDTDN